VQFISDTDLIAVARRLVGEFRTSKNCVAGGVAAAILSDTGRLYTGICIDTSCSMGFCAEHAAVAEMLKARESVIASVVAVSATKGIVPPCGRCRELMWQLDPRNRTARVIVGEGEVLALEDLLPQPGRSTEAAASAHLSGVGEEGADA
jgi:cytidine deaminase